MDTTNIKTTNYNDVATNADVDDNLYNVDHIFETQISLYLNGFEEVRKKLCLDINNAKRVIFTNNNMRKAANTMMQLELSNYEVSNSVTLTSKIHSLSILIYPRNEQS
ncbi:26305_t:CDS:2 [Gigaspora rosea]|nr:26305_t:CDS:2 [Gigaspora rosea]